MGGDYPGGVIDLRLHRPQTRLMLVEQTLTTLQPNEDILLVFRERPAHLPGHIHAQYPGRFEITPVDEGPEVWSLRVHPLSDPQ
mgnify:FL=1